MINDGRNRGAVDIEVEGYVWRAVLVLFYS
jgi:hypothetical protein